MLVKISKYLIYIWLAVVITAAYLYAPLAKGLDEFTRVLYFHVPLAWITVIAFFLNALYSIIYLKKRELKFFKFLKEMKKVVRWKSMKKLSMT